MKWNNQTILKVLQLYKDSPCIWNPQHNQYNNRPIAKKAWNDIIKTMKLPISIQDLKKKKESLMAAYRSYKIKIKKSESTATDASELYQPTWFAFELMDSFLGPIYKVNETTIITENEDMTVDGPDIEENEDTVYSPEEDDDETFEIVENEDSDEEYTQPSTTSLPTKNQPSANTSQRRIWDSKTILKFLKIYKSHPCIWDPKNRSHKNRLTIKNAWESIQSSINIPCTINELKKKKDSLMAAYRIYKHKIKNSKMCARKGSEGYHPTWFAFNLMDSFLGSVFMCSSPERRGPEEVVYCPEVKEVEDVSRRLPSDQKEAAPSTTSTSSYHNLHRIKKYSSTEAIKRRQHHTLPETPHIKHQEPRHFSNNQPDDDDECSLYGLLIAKKLKKLSENRRDVMMVKINQLFVDERRENDRLNATTTVVSYSPTPSNCAEEPTPSNDPLTDDDLRSPSAGEDKYTYHGASDSQEQYVLWE